MSYFSSVMWTGGVTIGFGIFVIIVDNAGFDSQYRSQYWNYFLWLYGVMSVLSFAFCISWTIATIVKNTVKPDISLIYPVLCTLVCYVLTSALFAILYNVVEFEFPNSFNVEIGIAKAAYFSVITLATVGFGDIYPTSATARFVVMLEVITGVFYNVIFFALVSSQIINRAITKVMGE